MKNIQMLEMHAVHQCNLLCESCSHYSNHRLKGTVSLEDGSRWMEYWSHRIKPNVFAILGGEPTMHPQLVELFLLVRKNWPDTRIQIQTNGFFIQNQPELPGVLAKDSNSELCISIHSNSLNYWEKFSPQFDLLIKWKRKYGINMHIWRSYKHWTRRYRGFGDSVEPFEDGNPRKSWEICMPKNCPQLFDGAIWKCPPIAYLCLLNKAYNLSSKWDPYLHYIPLKPDCTEEELNSFFDRKEEIICGMCPTKLEHFKLCSPIVQNNKPSNYVKIFKDLQGLSPKQIRSYLWHNLNLLMIEKYSVSK